MTWVAFQNTYCRGGNDVACVVYWYFKKHSIPSNCGQKEAMHVIHVFADDIFVLRSIRTVKHGYSSSTEGSITKENITYAFMGTYELLMEYLWLTRLQFWLTKYHRFFQADTCMVPSGYRPKRDLHSVFFPFDYYTSLKYLQTVRHRWFSISESSLRKYKVQY